jgi:nitrilase
MRIAVVQMSPGSNKDENIAQAVSLLDRAYHQERPDLVVLPEVWTCLGGDRAGKFAAAELLPAIGSGAAAGPAYSFLRQFARSHGVFVHGGSIGEREAGGERLFNTTVVFDPDGREVARYRKIHLFDITGPDGSVYGESRTYGAGDQVVTYQARDLTVGCSICYDMRFPELFLQLRRAGADLIVVPAAFTLHTGKDHWEVLLRARAIETQCWVAAAATTGKHPDGHGGTRETYGHSMIINPWGHVVARASDGPGIASAAIDLALSAKLRTDMPVLEHRRLV